MILELDCNSKVGKDVIKNDPNEMSENGKLLLDIIKRQNIESVYSSQKCTGLITRMRKTNGKFEKSIIDYVIVCNKVAPYVKAMIIDDKRKNVLKSFRKNDGKSIVKKLDHNVIRCKLSFHFDIKYKRREEVYRLRNKEDLKVFKENTENAVDLIKCFQTNENIQIQGK